MAKRLTSSIQQANSPPARSPWVSYLAEAHADLGQLDEAWRCIDEAMSAIETTKERWFEAETNRIAGEIALKSLESVVNDKVVVLTGYNPTPTALAVAPLATEARIPEIVVGAVVSIITARSPYIVRTMYAQSQVTIPMAQWAAKNGIKVFRNDGKITRVHPPDGDAKNWWQRLNKVLGKLIGQEILEHYEYRGQVMRVLFTAQDSQTIRDAFGRAKPNSECARFYAAAVARRQADQIYNLSLTRTATVILGRGARRVIGVGRVRRPWPSYASASWKSGTSCHSLF
jgi:hypothetical protein